MTRTLCKLLILPVFLFAGCSPPKYEDKPPAKTPVVITPNPPPKPYGTRLEMNSGSGFGTTTHAFKTSVSVGNTSAQLGGTTTHGYRVQYNVQDPNSPR